MSVQYIKSARPGKPVTWFVYAYKGGPRILKAVQPRKPKLTADQWTAVADAEKDQNAPVEGTLNALIWKWRQSEEWKKFEPSTKSTWGAQLDLISARWGTKPIAVWNDPRMAEKVVKWRDERTSSPRSADIGVTVLKALLKAGKLLGRVRLNVAEGIPTLYRGGDRAEIIWTDDDMEAFRLAAIADDAEHIVDVLRLAACTGLRRADLASLTWAHLGEFAIIKTARKKSRGKRRRVTIPMTPDLEALIEELKARPRKEGVETVLVSSRGIPWSPMGMGTSFNRIRNLAKIVHMDEDDDGNPIERKKHLHDVRGTFCTLLLIDWEMNDRDAADVMGWSPERVGKIRKVYVDRSKVVVALGERIKAKQIAKQSAAQ